MKGFKVSVKKMLLLFAMLMLGTSITFAQVITLPTVSGKVGTTNVSVPIQVSNLGSNVKSYQFNLSYDNTKIEVTNASIEGTLSKDGTLQVNPDIANGKLYVGWAHHTAIAPTAGVLLNLTISFKSGGTSSLGVGNTFLLNNTQVAVANGSAIAATIEVYVASTTAKYNQEVLIPIKTSAIISTDNVKSFNFTATYDASKIEILGTALEGTYGSAGSIAENLGTLGTVQVAWANPTAIVVPADGILLYLKGKMKAKVATDIVLTAFQFNSGNPGAAFQKGTVTATNTAPVFAEATVAKTVAENSNLAFTVAATDADGDALTYSSTTLPTGATFVAGAFSWTPTYVQAGTYTITFTATDGTATANQVATITVTDVNRTPTIALSKASPMTVAEGQELKFSVTVADDDTDNTLTLTTGTLPTGAAFSATTKDFAWTPAYNQQGSYDVVFTVKDNKNATASVTAKITVTNINTAPSFVLPGAKQMKDTTILGGKYLLFNFVAIDPEGDAVTYTLVNPPAGASIANTTGLFVWRPVNTQAGKHQIVVVASDATLSTQSRIITIQVDKDVKVLDEGIPVAYELFQNYPNPFNPSTSIKFALPKESMVKLSVFNILGQEVGTLVNSTLVAGFHSINFNAVNLPSGMYIYKIDAENFTQIKKMILMK